MRPLLVYLDSSDYSTLSDPKRQVPGGIELTEQLRRWVSTGQIVCCYSGIHLREMAPIDAAYADASLRRINLMIELCGRNALISQDLILKAELQALLGVPGSAPEVLSSVGVWYPKGLADVMAETRVDWDQSVREAVDELPMNRSQRRTTEQTLRGPKAKASLRKAVIRSARSDSLQQILKKYPMREVDARVLSRFIAGDASAEDANRAFEESLRDPRWMIQWFREHHAKLSPFIEQVRAPMLPIIESLNELRSLSAASEEAHRCPGNGQTASFVQYTQWMIDQDLMLANTARKLSAVLLGSSAEQKTPSAIDANCPSLSVAVRTLHSAWFSAVSQRSPRPPVISDFSDGLHAMYAPYVDVFRADSFMTPIITAHTKKHSVRVVGKPTNLASTIDELLKKSPGSNPRQ